MGQLDLRDVRPKPPKPGCAAAEIHRRRGLKHAASFPCFFFQEHRGSRDEARCGSGDLFRQAVLHEHWTAFASAAVCKALGPSLLEACSVSHPPSCERNTRSYPSSPITAAPFPRRNTASLPHVSRLVPRINPAPPQSWPSENIPLAPRQHERRQGVAGRSEIRGQPETSRLPEKGGAHGVGTLGVETFHERVETFQKVPPFRGVPCSVRGPGEGSPVDVL